MNPQFIVENTVRVALLFSDLHCERHWNVMWCSFPVFEREYDLSWLAIADIAYPWSMINMGMEHIVPLESHIGILWRRDDCMHQQFNSIQWYQCELFILIIFFISDGTCCSVSHLITIQFLLFLFFFFFNLKFCQRKI